MEFATRQEREIAKEVIKEIEGYAKDDLVLFLEDKEIEEQIKDHLIDLEEENEMEFFEMLETIERIVHRKLEVLEKKQSKNYSAFGEYDYILKRGDGGYFITSILNDEYFIRIPKNFLKWYDEETNTLHKKAPLRFVNGEIKMIDPFWICIKKFDNFYLDYPEEEIEFTNTKMIHEDAC